VRPADEVILDADGDGLRAAEARGGGVAARAGVVVVEADDGVVEQVAPEVGQPIIDFAPQLLLQGRAYSAREAVSV